MKSHTVSVFRTISILCSGVFRKSGTAAKILRLKSTCDVSYAAEEDMLSGLSRLSLTCPSASGYFLVERRFLRYGPLRQWTFAETGSDPISSRPKYSSGF